MKKSDELPKNLPMSDQCPNCGSFNNGVVDSRIDNLGRRYRKRKCMACDTKWITYEITQEEYDILQGKIIPNKNDRIKEN